MKKYLICILFIVVYINSCIKNELLSEYNGFYISEKYRKIFSIQNNKIIEYKFDGNKLSIEEKNELYEKNNIFYTKLSDLDYLEKNNKELYYLGLKDIKDLLLFVGKNKNESILEFKNIHEYNKELIGKYNIKKIDIIKNKNINIKEINEMFNNSTLDISEINNNFYYLINDNLFNTEENNKKFGNHKIGYFITNDYSAGSFGYMTLEPNADSIDIYYNYELSIGQENVDPKILEVKLQYKK